MSRIFLKKNGNWRQINYFRHLVKIGSLRARKRRPPALIEQNICRSDYALKSKISIICPREMVTWLYSLPLDGGGQGRGWLRINFEPLSPKIATLPLPPPIKGPSREGEF